MTPQGYSGHDHLEVWRWKLEQPAFVYVIRGAFDTAIKVGFAKDVLVRMAELQTGNPRRLNLMYVIPGDRHLEHGLQSCLWDSRVIGEWFDGPKVEPFLEAVAQLADRMIEGHDKTKRLPDVYALAKDLLPSLARPDSPAQQRPPRKLAPVEVGQGGPMISAEERQRRLHAHWMRPARPDD